MKKSSLLFILMLHFLSENCYVFGQTQVSPKYSVDKTVNSMISKGDTLIVGGGFNFVGRYTGGGALFTTSADTAIANYPRIIGEVYSSTPDGSGGFYIYGNYHRETEAATASSARIEHILPDFSFESGFSLSVGALFKLNKILYHNGILYIGGDHVDHIAGQVARDFSAIDVATKLLVSWIPVIDSGGNIQTFNASGNTLYVAGDFYKIGGQFRNKIASIQINTGVVKPWIPGIPSPGYSDIKFYKNKLILGGGFGDGVFNNHACALVDTVTGDTVQYIFSSSNLYWAASVQQIVLSGDTLFASSNGTYDTRITAINLAAGNSIIWKKFFSMNSVACDLTCIPGTLFISGSGYNQIYKTDSPTIVQQKVGNSLSLNTQTGDLKNWFPDPVGFIVNDVWTMSKSGTNIFIGGKFSHVNGLARGSVFMLNTATQQVLPFQMQTNLFDECKSLKLIDSILYVAGSFSKINDTSYNTSVAAFNINTGKQLPWYPINLGDAFAVEANSHYVFLGGSLTEPSGGAGRTGLFAIDRQTGSLSNWAPNPNNQVYALHLSKGKLYVGGQFSNISGQTRNHLASYDTITFNLSLWNPNPNGNINTITSSDSSIWIGGSFNMLGGTSASLFAAINEQSGFATLIPFPHYNLGNVNALIVAGHWIIVGGGFKNNTTDPCNDISLYDVLNKTLMSSGRFCLNIDNLGGNVASMALTGNDLYFGGSFTNVDGKDNATNIGRIGFSPSFFEVLDSVISYFPKEGGDSGNVTINFNGELIHAGMNMKLVSSGIPEIVAADSMISFPEIFQMNVTLDLRGRSLHDYDVVITDTNGRQYVYPNGFTIEKYIKPTLWANIIGDPVLRIGFNQVYTVTYGNNGNVDAELFPLLVTGLPLGTDIEILNPTFRVDSLPGFDTLHYSQDSFNHTFNDTTSGTNYRLFYVAKIPAGSTNSLGFIFHLPKTTTLHSYPTIQVILGIPLPDSYIDLSKIKLLRTTGTAESDLTRYIGCYTSLANLASSAYLDILGVNDANKCFKGVGDGISTIFDAYRTRENHKSPRILDAADMFIGSYETAESCLKTFTTLAFPESEIYNIAKFALHSIDYALKAGNAVENCTKKETNSNMTPIVGNAWDPNEKYGPGDSVNGFFLNLDKPISYTINFENAPAANLNAQTITVTDSLNPNYYDYSTFMFTSIVFSGQMYTLGSPAKSFIHDFNFRAKYGTIARVTGSFDTLTGVVKWKFESIDTITNHPTTNALLGILPPDTTSPLGQGYVSFIVNPNKNIGTNDVICNKATIVFDNNPPITTKCWQNIFDLINPASKVDSLPAIENKEQFIVNWKGTDNLSGIKQYDVYVSVNDSAYVRWQSGVPTTADTFNGIFGNKYSFYSIATDKAGNIEAVKNYADATTKLADISDIKVYPNPAQNIFIVKVHSGTEILNLKLFDLQGKSIDFDYIVTNNTATIKLINTVATGFYILKIQTSDNTFNRKIIVEK